MKKVSTTCLLNRDSTPERDILRDILFERIDGFQAERSYRAPAPEWAIQNQYLFNLPAGLHQLTTPAFLSWHPQWGSKQIWMRITLSEQPWTVGSNPGAKGNGGSGPREGYQIGETEDYYFVPDTSALACDSMCQDINGDGVTNIDDLTIFVADWLASCP